MPVARACANALPIDARLDPVGMRGNEVFLEVGHAPEGGRQLRVLGIDDQRLVA